VLNGTTTFILGQLETGSTMAAAVDLAQRRGFTEPDPAKDLDGTDAAEKLTILLRQFARVSVSTPDLPTTGIEGLTPADLRCAAAFGGRILPVAYADWSDGAVSAWVGPAFVPHAHPLSVLRGVLNGICLERPGMPPLVFTGPGAGPDATAATILDDVIEAAAARPLPWTPARQARLSPDRAREWLVRIRHDARVVDGTDVADLLAGFDVWIRRASGESERCAPNTIWVATYPCDSRRVEAGLDVVRAAADCEAFAIPSLEAMHG